MAVVDLDMQIVEDAEANYQVRADLVRDDWHYGKQKVPACLVPLEAKCVSDLLCRLQTWQ